MKHFATFFITGMVVLLLVTKLFAQWEPDVRLTYDDSLSQTCQSNTWSVAADGNNNVHVVWGDKRDGNRKIYYKRSTDGGTNWGSDIRLTDALPWSGAPGIAVSNSYIHTVWNDDRDGNSETYYKCSTDEGANWGSDIRLTNDSAHTNTPCVAVSNLYIHVVVDDERDGNYEIYYKRSTDGGTNWEIDTRLTDAPEGSNHPSVAVSGQYIHVVWGDNRDGNRETYYKRSTDGGTNWEIDIRLTNDPASSGSPCVAVSGSNVHVVWFDERDGNFEIYYKRSTDSGTSWGTDIRLTDDPGYSGFPSVAASGSNVHVVWCDQRDGNNEIYYKCSTNGGATWGADIRLTNNPDFSTSPSAAVSGTNVHVVWNDNRDGNDEIYYKRNPTGNAVAEEASNYQLSISNYQLLVSPNPFSTSTTITLSFPSIGHPDGIVDPFHGTSRAESIELNIYDLSGRLVRDLSVGIRHLASGTSTVSWDGRDNSNGELSSGVYFLKFKTEDYSETRKVLIVR